MAANIKYAVYKIFNGTDFDTVYFKAPAAAITESSAQQFISSESKALIESYLHTFNTANKLVQLNGSGKIPSGLINADFADYLDKRSTAGTQSVHSQVNFTNASGVYTENGINLYALNASPEDYNTIKSGGGAITLGIGDGAQEVTFSYNGILDFKEPTEIKNVKLGADNSAVPKSYVDTVIESGAKPKAAVIASSVIPYATIPSGVSTAIDGISVVAGNRVLLKNQTNKSENGIYEVSTGTWAKITEESNLKGALIFVEKGSTNNDSKWFHEGGGEWIKFSQTDQLQFNNGLVRSGDNVTLANNYIANGHIKSDAAISLSKLGTHSGYTEISDVAPITTSTSLDSRLSELAMTIYRIRGDVSNDANYGEWNANSLSIKAVNDVAVAKQNPVRFGTASPTTSLYEKGDVYLLYDQTTPAP